MNDTNISDGVSAKQICGRSTYTRSDWKCNLRNSYSYIISRLFVKSYHYASFFPLSEWGLPAELGQVSPARRDSLRLFRGDGHHLLPRGQALPGGEGQLERGHRGRLDGVVRTHRSGHDSRPQILPRTQVKEKKHLKIHVLLLQLQEYPELRSWKKRGHHVLLLRFHRLISRRSKKVLKSGRKKEFQTRKVPFGECGSENRKYRQQSSERSRILRKQQQRVTDKGGI